MPNAKSQPPSRPKFCKSHSLIDVLQDPNAQWSEIQQAMKEQRVCTNGGISQLIKNSVPVNVQVENYNNNNNKEEEEDDPKKDELKGSKHKLFRAFGMQQELIRAAMMTKEPKSKCDLDIGQELKNLKDYRTQRRLSKSRSSFKKQQHRPSLTSLFDDSNGTFDYDDYDDMEANGLGGYFVEGRSSFEEEEDEKKKHKNGMFQKIRSALQDEVQRNNNTHPRPRLMRHRSMDMTQQEIDSPAPPALPTPEPTSNTDNSQQEHDNNNNSNNKNHEATTPPFKTRRVFKRHTMDMLQQSSTAIAPPPHHHHHYHPEPLPAAPANETTTTSRHIPNLRKRFQRSLSMDMLSTSATSSRSCNNKPLSSSSKIDTETIRRALIDDMTGQGREARQKMLRDLIQFNRYELAA